MKTTTIKVQGMTCGGCVSSVRSALEHAGGVKTAEVSLEKKEAIVTFDETSTNEQELAAAIHEAGYEVVA